VFGECKKTCDLAAMFVNHQPKRRRYDKRTSSANWGDDGFVHMRFLHAFAPKYLRPVVV
jgi:hypothetical protein